MVSNLSPNKPLREENVQSQTFIVPSIHCCTIAFYSQRKLDPFTTFYAKFMTAAGNRWVVGTNRNTPPTLLCNLVCGFWLTIDRLIKRNFTILRQSFTNSIVQI